MPANENRRESSFRCRGRLTAIVNISLCGVGSVFIVVGVIHSSLLLYVGCAFIGAAIGGFIRSRLPVHNMVPLHMMYRSDLQRMHAFNDGTQTFVLLRPNGISQSVINANTTIKPFSPGFSMQNSDAKDDVSVVSSLFEVDEFICIICLTSFNKNQSIRQLRCGHFYHVACIDRWLRINEVCPTCRVPVTNQLQVRKKPLLESADDQPIAVESVASSNDAEQPATTSAGPNNSVQVDIVSQQTDTPHSSSSHLQEISVEMD